MIQPPPALFKWRHFEPEIIVCAVRWYLRFSLPYRDVEELLLERGLPADHTGIWRWVQRYVPELNKRCRRELKLTNGSRRVDETYICQGGNWRYMYRAVDATGATIDFPFSAERDAASRSRRDILRRLGAGGASALLPGLASSNAQTMPSGPVTPVTVTITDTAIGVIGPAFAGLSYEKAQMANPFFSPQNANAIELFRLIGPSLLRIGGNSVDRTTWMPRPPTSTLLPDF
jgi:hypothetical protein